ncbi:lytic transglycosylase domain-containing protein [Anaerovibrio slackiae]|uniref:lytic transglycosylase domain-containing protein n=1 Tax=Anaerovibrio slackiae TaxID=2652309 RepID=UPI00386E5425
MAGEGQMQYTDEERELRRQRLLEHLEAKRRVVSFAIGMCVLLAVFVAFLVLQHEDVQRSYIYPYDYREDIVEYSQRYQVDPYLVAAVIKAESKFKSNAKSSYGAVGLMQLMPETAVWIAGQLDDTQFSVSSLQEPWCNIRYGTWYLGSLQEEFRGNEVLMLAAYNAGRGNVLEWMEKYGWDYDFQDVDAIPFRETEEYVRSVLKNKAKYYQLYGERHD